MAVGEFRNSLGTPLRSLQGQFEPILGLRHERIGQNEGSRN
jgi:hypothetical protein